MAPQFRNLLPFEDGDEMTICIVAISVDELEADVIANIEKLSFTDRVPRS
jgi:hypothetical protein